ncbi:MAG TPA: TonB-dependent receptor [Steroidobacteraceae bacterium]|nr:TonB-dependent receptor [Steroidobacteraceae bacterium]
MRWKMRRLSLGSSAVLGASTAFAGGVPGVGLEEVVVTAQRAELVGEVQSASQGTVTRMQLETRPVLRTGELLETVPGLVVTQHSGDGKANQYFLRGFNLDHGTDFATRVDVVPVNMPTHAHGQGYTDINFVIPELIDSIEYRKGTYYADEGNFSAAGSADLRYRRDLGGGLMVAEGGENAFARGLIGFSPQVAGGNLLLAGEYTHNDGPWVLAEGLRKFNGVAKFSRGDRTDGFSVTAAAYHGEWRSTDQIPERAVDAGLLDRFGYVDPTDGGESHRYSLGAEWRHENGPWAYEANGYAVDYKLDLFSNFTYDLDQTNGDQFEQFDDRRIYGGRAGVSREFQIASREARVRFGTEIRRDDIGTVGLYRTDERERLGTIRQDGVEQTSSSFFLEQEVKLTDFLRVTAGARYDYFDFKVDSNLAANSGKARDHITSPKLAIVVGPWAKTEFFVDLGRGFHSNDARGTTITVDPSDGVTPADRVSPLVTARGGEIGARTAILPRTQLSASLWTLDLDSELLFVGDGGITESNRASRRHGLELAAFVKPVDWVTVDADIAWAHARFTQFDPAGNYIPNAVDRVVSFGLAAEHPSGWFGGARLRYFGAAPLVEDNSVRSKPTQIVNADIGYRFSNGLSAAITGLNLLNSQDNDITYFYESQLPGEAAPVADRHFHPVEPRTFRFTLKARF